MSAADTPEVEPRRAQRVTIEWSNDGAAIGRLYVGGEYWGAVEWSAKRQAWCVEDVEGACLRHVASIRGQAASKAKAVTLAREMIRDGRMPTPQQAREEHTARRTAQAERRGRQPAEQAHQRARAEASATEMALARIRWAAEADERRAGPLWEALHEVFDFADSELWRSNSFAVLRPRLVVHLKVVVAELEDTCMRYRRPLRRRSRAEWEQRLLADAEAKLARVRKVLAAMEHQP